MYNTDISKITFNMFILNIDFLNTFIQKSTFLFSMDVENIKHNNL